MARRSADLDELVKASEALPSRITFKVPGEPRGIPPAVVGDKVDAYSLNVRIEFEGYLADSDLRWMLRAIRAEVKSETELWLAAHPQDRGFALRRRARPQPILYLSSLKAESISFDLLPEVPPEVASKVAAGFTYDILKRVFHRLKAKLVGKKSSPETVTRFRMRLSKKTRNGNVETESEFTVEYDRYPANTSQADR